MTGLIVLLVIRLINGAGMSLATTSSGAAVPDIVPKARLAEGVGIYGILSTVAQALGPLLALAIVNSGEGMAGFTRLFFVSAAFCAISAIAGCFIRYERKQKRERAKEQTLEVAPEHKQPEPEPIMEQGAPGSIEVSRPEKTFLGFDYRVLIVSIVVIINYFGLSSVLSFLTLYGKTRGFAIEYIGWFFFASAAGVMISRLFCGKIVDRRGADVVVIPGFLVLATAFFIIPLMPSLPFLVCIGLPYGIAVGAVNPSLNAIMFKRSSPKRRGTASAAFYLSIDVGIMAGAPVMGLIADTFSFTWVYWLSSVSIIVALLLYILIVSEKRYQRRSADA